MMPSRFYRPLLVILIAVALAGGYYWIEHRPRADGNQEPSSALVIVTQSTNACFSDMVRVTGFVVPRREAVTGVDQDGSRVSDILIHEGEMVTENQELARLAPLQAGNARPAQTSLRAPAAGQVTQVNTMVGAPASPQGGPMFRIAVNNESEFDAEVPAVHMLKLNAGATARISRDDGPDVIGRLRLVMPQIDRATQLGHVRISLPKDASMKIGTFTRASIDARRSCGVSVPKTSIDHLTLQVVKNNIVETRQVRVGLTSDTSVEILEGLNVGETVVADAGTSLHDGDKIRTISADELDRTRVR